MSPTFFFVLFMAWAVKVRRSWVERRNSVGRDWGGWMVCSGLGQ